MPKPTTLEEALEEIEKLKAEKRALQVKLTAAKWSGGAKLAKAQLGVASARGAGAKLLTTLSGKGISQVMKEDGVTTVDRDELSDLVGLVINNSKAKDAQERVLTNPLMSGKVDGLLRALAVDRERGLRQSEVKKRAEKFGRNEIPMEPQASLFTLMRHALSDPTLIFLCFAAVISLVIGIFIEKDPMGWLEGTAILTAVVVVVMVGSINDYQKEKQFRALSAKNDDMKVTVIRDGQQVEMSCHDVVVGDIMKLSTGDILTCDGYVIGNNDLQISEKALTGETDLMRKGEYEIVGDKIKKAPILFAGTMVQDGQGKILVIAVGTGSYQGRMQQKINEAEAEHTKSILQEKLDDMTEFITQVGASAAVLTVAVLAVRMYLAFQQQLCCKEAWDHSVHWSEVLGYFISGVTIFVVAVPEGLPLAVTIALAFSVSKMLKDNNLVRHLSACETMGGATTICSDKTGTLTTSRMTVTKIYCGGMTLDIGSARSGLTGRVCELVQQAAVINSMSKTNLKGQASSPAPLYTGNDTECGMLVMANDLSGPGTDYNSDNQVPTP
jgi:Ca2+-transporting ATPase